MSSPFWSLRVAGCICALNQVTAPRQILFLFYPECGFKQFFVCFFFNFRKTFNSHYKVNFQVESCILPSHSLPMQPWVRHFLSWDSLLVKQRCCSPSAEPWGHFPFAFEDPGFYIVPCCTASLQSFLR